MGRAFVLDCTRGLGDARDCAVFGRYISTATVVSRSEQNSTMGVPASLAKRGGGGEGGEAKGGEEYEYVLPGSARCVAHAS